MAAAVPLPPEEQRRAFLMYTHFLSRTSLRGYGGTSQFSFFPKIHLKYSAPKKDKRKSTFLDGRARPVLITARADIGLDLLF